MKLTLESLERQWVKSDRFQVIVADDGSGDGTIELLRSFRPSYRLRWTRPAGRGSSAARNAAAQLADQEVLIFLDDDQITSPQLVGAHLEAQQRYGAVLVQGNYPLAAGWDHDGASMIFEQSRRTSLGALEPGVGHYFHLWGGNFSIRRDTWVDAGGFDESLPRSQDLDFGLRVADLGVPMVFEQQALSHHLHRIGIRGFRQQHFNEGRCLVKISRKRGVPVEVLLDARVDGPLDRACKSFWARYPRWAGLAGRAFSAVEWAADLVRVRPAQLFSSRVVRRYHELGGMAVESR